MRRCIATVSVSGTLHTKLKAIAGAGFDSIELFENDLIASPQAPREIAMRAADAGLTIDLYQPFRDFEGVSPEQFRRNLDRAERKFDVMAELGATSILLCSNVQPHAIDDAALCAAQLRTLAERACERGMRLCYEALSWGRHVKHYREAYDIAMMADHPSLGVCLDSFHVLALGDDPAGIADLRGEKIFFLQIADAPLLTMDVLQWSRHFRCFPGQGGFDLANFVRHTLEAGYGGPLSLEVFNDVFRAAPDRQIAGNAMQGLLLLEEQIATQSEGKFPDLFTPPPPPAIKAFSFLEFAASPAEPEGSSLEHFLLQMGFARLGAHRSKAVTMYGQGSIRVVVNRQPGSDAEAHFAAHGPSVCAIGLSSEDAALAHRRATAFHVAEYHSPIGPDESRIPAIRSVDGSLIYFLSATDQQELAHDFHFEELSESSSANVGLVGIDHLSFALSGELFDASLLFFRIVLGLEPEESIDVPDPFGLVRSRALHSADGLLRLALNVSESPGTGVARSLRGNHGATVQHIAFTCHDIFATARACRAAGVAMLHIPPNYYEDLDSRTEIGSAFLEKLERDNVLFERAAEGDFLHFYTQPFEGRFFFECVQRVGGYKGFGAGNALVRMAAQLSDK